MKSPFCGTRDSLPPWVLTFAFFCAAFLTSIAAPAELSAAECTGNCQHGGYWIVSTYRMPQEPGCCPKSMNFSCYYKPVCGTMRPSSVAEMQGSLIPGAPTCIFVHGSFVGIDHALDEARYTYHWLQKGKPQCPLNVICLVWPSDDIDALLPAVSVVHNGLLADHNGIYLSHLIDCLPAESPLTLIGHSHGTRVISSCLHFRGGGDVLGCKRTGPPCSCRSIVGIYAAAAINHEWLVPGDKFGQALTQVDCILNLINRKDIALTVYPLVSPRYGRALSQTGTTFIDRRRLGPYNQKMHEMDLTFAVGIRHSWSLYYSNLEISRAISPYIYRNRRPAGPCDLAEECDLPELRTSDGSLPIDLPEPDSRGQRISISLPDPTSPAVTSALFPEDEPLPPAPEAETTTQ